MYLSKLKLIVVLGISTLFVACSSNENAKKSESDSLAIGTTTQLFLDDYIIESTVGLTKVPNKPDTNRVALFGADRAWEQRVFYANVIRVGDDWRMYYSAGVFNDLKGGEDVAVGKLPALAESSNGIDWSFPKLKENTGVFETTNIILKEDADGSVNIDDGFGIYDPNAVESEKYKLGYGLWKGGLRVALSADGYSFNKYEGNPVFEDAREDTQQSIVWDPRINKWVWFYRIWDTPTDGRGGWSRFNDTIRKVGRMESSDFKNWTNPQLILDRTAEHPANSDWYGLQVTLRHGIMIGLLWTSEWEDQTVGLIGQQRAQLVVSRDSGFTWTFVDRENMWFDVGPSGSFDDEVVWPSTIISVGDEDYIYYTGSTYKHASNPSGRSNPYRIGLARIPRDRFVAMQAGSSVGSLTTKVITIPERKQLYLNVDVKGSGYCKVVVESAAGETLLGESLPIINGKISGKVGWAKGDISNLGYKNARLKFYLKDAALYSFQFK